MRRVRIQIKTPDGSPVRTRRPKGTQRAAEALAGCEPVWSAEDSLLPSHYRTPDGLRAYVVGALATRLQVESYRRPE